MNSITVLRRPPVLKTTWFVNPPLHCHNLKWVLIRKPASPILILIWWWWHWLDGRCHMHRPVTMQATLPVVVSWSCSVTTALIAICIKYYKNHDEQSPFLLSPELCLTPPSRTDTHGCTRHRSATIHIFVWVRLYHSHTCSQNKHSVLAFDIISVTEYEYLSLVLPPVVSSKQQHVDNPIVDLVSHRKMNSITVLGRLSVLKTILFVNPPLTWE